MKIYTIGNNVLIESVNNAKDKKNIKDEITNFANQLLDYNEFIDLELINVQDLSNKNKSNKNKCFFKINMSSYDGKIRHELNIINPYTLDKLFLTNDVFNIIKKFLIYYNNRNSKTPLKIYNGSENYIINNGYYITRNPHISFVSANTGEYKFTLKFHQNNITLSTAFKEGFKIQLINYMIYAGSTKIENLLQSADDFNLFFDYVNGLKENDFRTGMSKFDFVKIRKIINDYKDIINNNSQTSESTLNTLKGIVHKYKSSCNAICVLAADSNSFVTRDESQNGLLKKYKDSIRAEQINDKSFVKNHPADILLIGSVLTNYCGVPLNMSDIQNTYCAISLKEEKARYGKITNYILSLTGNYIDKDGKESGLVSVKTLRDMFLTQDLHEFMQIPTLIADNSTHVNNNIIDNNVVINDDLDQSTLSNPELNKAFNSKDNNDLLNNNFFNESSAYESFEKICNKYSVYLPASLDSNPNTAKKIKVMVTCKNIENIQDKLTYNLSLEQLYNLFFTALISSFDKVKQRKQYNTLFANLINVSIQIGKYDYVLAKDTVEDHNTLHAIDYSVRVKDTDITNVSVTYNPNNVGCKKITTTVINVKFNNKELLNSDNILKSKLRRKKEDKRFKVDIRQFNSQSPLPGIEITEQSKV